MQCNVGGGPWGKRVFGTINSIRKEGNDLLIGLDKTQG